MEFLYISLRITNVADKPKILVESVFSLLLALSLEVIKALLQTYNYCDYFHLKNVLC